MKRPEEVLRWGIHQRLQHGLLMASVTLLVVTGFPLRWAHAPLAQGFVRLFGGVELFGALHRAGAVLLLLAGLYHAGYLIAAGRAHGFRAPLLPRRQDARDLATMLRYLLGRAPEQPRFGRYSFVQKFDYWAAVIGTAIMGVTGLVLWFPIAATRLFPPTVLEVAAVVHSYEALLAAFAIVVWHLYHVHLNPEVFPMSRVWLTGRISHERLAAEHPLESPNEPAGKGAEQE